MCKHYTVPLEKKDRHFINSEENNNCVLCLAEKEGPMTQAKIAEYLGLSKMRVCQIEHQALAKLDKKMRKILHLPF